MLYKLLGQMKPGYRRHTLEPLWLTRANGMILVRVRNRERQFLTDKSKRSEESKPNFTRRPRMATKSKNSNCKTSWNYNSENTWMAYTENIWQIFIHYSMKPLQKKSKHVDETVFSKMGPKDILQFEWRKLKSSRMVFKVTLSSSFCVKKNDPTTC